MVRILLALCFITVFSTAQEPAKSRPVKNGTKPPAGSRQRAAMDSVLHKEITDAFTNPYRFIRTGRLERLIHALKGTGNTAIKVMPPDSLTYGNINSPRINRNNYDRCVLNVLRYAHIRGVDSDGARQSLLLAGLLAFRKIDNPRLALAVYELALASGYNDASKLKDDMAYYINHDLPHLSLLKEPWHKKSDTEKRAYVAQLKEILKKNPESLLSLKFSKHIGDVYYSMAKYRPMIQWYVKAVSIDSTVAKETPVGYRIAMGRKILLRKRLITITYLIYGILLLALVFLFYRFRPFCVSRFLRKALIVIPLFLVIGTVTLFFDFAVTAGGITKSLENATLYFARPIVAFSVLDVSCLSDLGIIVLLGMLPVLVSLVFTSFEHKTAKKALFVMLPILIVSTWGHYILYRVYDDKMLKQAVMTRAHIYFDGELETMLMENPEKVMRANPQLFKSNNSDLDIFVRENKPALLQDEEKGIKKADD